MRVKFVLIVVLVILALPCMEIPEWAGMYDDASNDFVLAPSKTELAGDTVGRSATHLPARRVTRSSRMIAITASSISTLVSHETHLLPNLVNVQKK
jgi:hypothetical protein